MTIFIYLHDDEIVQLKKIHLATTPPHIHYWREILMLPKEIFSFGTFFFIVTFYLDFHPFWLLVFTLVSLAGLFGMMKKPKRSPEEEVCMMADINPF